MSAFDVRDAYTSLCGVAQGFLGAGQGEPVLDGTKTLSSTVLGIGERTSTSGTQVFYARDENGALVSQRGSGADGFFLFDALGSVSGLTDRAGNLTRSFSYDPYGNPTTTGTTPVYFGYAGGYTDTAGLVRFGQRLYDPTQGRWTQPDPLDQTGDLQDGNAYLYASGDPVNVLDQSGECPWCVAAALAVGRVAVRYVAGRLAGTAAGRVIGLAGMRFAGTRIGSRAFGYGQGLNTGRTRIGLSSYKGVDRFSIRVEGRHFDLYPTP